MNTALDAAPTATAPGPDSREFSVLRQKLNFDVDLLHQTVKGETEITVAPQNSNLRQIRLHCRQCDILSVTVEDRPASLQYVDPYRSVSPHPGWGIKQHHQFKDRVDAFLGENAREELTIEVPKRVIVKESAPAAGGVQDAGSNRSRQTMTMTTASTSSAIPDMPAAGGAELQTVYQTLSVKISFALKNIRDGLHFVGLSPGDNRYPTVYTRNSPFPGPASCLFPCLDDPTERLEWEISVTCAKTVGNALGLGNADPAIVGETGDEPSPDAQDDSGFSEQERAMDLSVVCSGQFEDESDDPSDPTRKMVTYSTRDVYCSANQIGFAIAPFEQVDLSDLREVDEDDKLAEDAVQVIAYCLPGRAAEVRNTVLPMAKAVDFFTERYTRYFYSSYHMCFLDDLPQDSVTTAGLSFLSTRLLFPQEIIDPIFNSTRKVVHALATQWAGVGVTAREPADNWCIIGMAYFMADMFMKSLCGNNEHRFQQKLAVDRIVELDRARPSLHSLGSLLQLDPSELEFVALKSAVVLSILDRRLTKSSTSSGVSRIINRTMTATKGGDAEATLLTTGQFQKTCERTGHAKLDTFFLQWVFNAGCPTFKVNQRFNKKKLVVEMTIEQTQATVDSSAPSQPQDLNPDFFSRDVNEELTEVWADKMARFTGPMTIRIHEADGTPYEHIIDISAAQTTQKLEIPYNTKYKRLKRNRRGQKDPSKGGNAASQEGAGEGQDESLLYCLGDVLQSEQDVKDWQLSEWTPEQEKEMSDDSYEWIRMDADFEWICKVEINLQPWMFVSQLQQDRDVVAQFESLQYMDAQGSQHPHPLISTFLTRTIMDGRYFHGVRTHAISLLPKVAKEHVGWIGLTHLRKIFSELCCTPGTFQARANDFSDRALYLVQCALPKALARVRDNAGHVPRSVKRLFVDSIKFNDNSQNEFSDCHWVSTLMSCLADILVKSPDHPPTALPYNERDEEDAFRRDAIGEIERYRRIDEWISSFQNVYSRTALDCLMRLSKSDVLQPKLADFLQYAKKGNADQLRLQAFRCLIELGQVRSGPIVKYILHSIAHDPSPYMRDQIFRIFNRGLGIVAIGEDRPSKPAQNVSEGLIIEEGTTEDRAQDRARKTTIEGAIKALKAEIGSDTTLANSLWTAVTSTTLTLRETRQLLTVPEILYDTKDTLVVKLKYPRYWRLRYDGEGKCVFIPTRVRTRPLRSFAHTPVSKPQPSRKPSMTIHLGRPSGSTSDSGALTGGALTTVTPKIGHTPTLQLNMPPPAQRPTPATERPPVKKEASPQLERKPSVVLPKPSKVVKLRVPSLTNPEFVAQLANMIPRTSAPSEAAPRKIKLSMSGGVKKEPSSPQLFAPFSSSPPPLQPVLSGSPSEQRRPSTASSSSSKRGQKRKSSERETPAPVNGHGDYFTDANGQLAGEPQAKKPKKSGGRRSSKASSVTPAPAASYAPIATPTSQQFGAWDTPTMDPSNGDPSAQFGAWDSGEKPRGVGFDRSPERARSSMTPVPHSSRVIKLKLPSARLANLVSQDATVARSQADSLGVGASSSLPDAFGAAPSQCGPAENGARSVGIDGAGGSGVEMRAIGEGLKLQPEDSPLSAVPNGVDVHPSDDDDDDLPMAHRNRPNNNTVESVDVANGDK